MNAHARRNSLIKLIALLLVFIIPLICSWFLYYFHDRINFRTTNYGTLVTPALHNDDLSEANSAKKIWQIVYVPMQCANEKEMFVLHQLRLALGKNSERLGLTVVTNQQCATQDAHDFRKIIFNAAQYTKLQSVFGKSLKTAKSKIYLVDPIGNVFMYYSDTSDPMHILKDLQKVLEVSQIG